MNKEEIQQIYGQKLFTLMEDMVNEFIRDDYSTSQIKKSLKAINESIRIGLYLLAIANNQGIMALKIYKANQELNEIRKNDFIAAYKNNKVKQFLAPLGKSDKISLMTDLGLNENSSKKALFNQEQKQMYKILNESILEDQKSDCRDGIEQFLHIKEKQN